jgi:hypothetical protein
MRLVIFDGEDTKNYYVNKEIKEKINLINLDAIEIKKDEKINKPKSKKKVNTPVLNKENQEFLDLIRSGSGFKKIEKINKPISNNK